MSGCLLSFFIVLILISEMCLSSKFLCICSACEPFLNYHWQHYTHILYGASLLASPKLYCLDL
ncbi:hypothetical protein RchiOBHm_Chr7g0229421 [Rosa chinensis]|uniref:Uncharacterized protein n=1 Tax=Rosa chinensis TaxID=74649 RepID=A0A2P6PF49_ROSCH|nr:hypothetical protein RchiOBHm_Chr7g0229421 [Rosa chinensis]